MLHRKIKCLGRFSPGDDGHAGAVYRVPAYGRVHRALAGQKPVHDRNVIASHGPRLQLAHQIDLRRNILGDDEKPARILVETMHDARARHTC